MRCVASGARLGTGRIAAGEVYRIETRFLEAPDRQPDGDRMIIRLFSGDMMSLMICCVQDLLCP